MATVSKFPIRLFPTFVIDPANSGTAVSFVGSKGTQITYTGKWFYDVPIPTKYAINKCGLPTLPFYPDLDSKVEIGWMPSFNEMYIDLSKVTEQLPGYNPFPGEGFARLTQMLRKLWADGKEIYFNVQGITEMKKFVLYARPNKPFFFQEITPEGNVGNIVISDIKISSSPTYWLCDNLTV